MIIILCICSSLAYVDMAVGIVYFRLPITGNPVEPARSVFAHDARAPSQSRVCMCWHCFPFENMK